MKNTYCEGAKALVLQRVFSAFLIIASGLFNAALVQAADIHSESLASRLVVVTVKGAIEPGDDKRLSEALGSAVEPWIYLTSNGGDVSTAMAIGSIVRKRRGWVYTNECYSACVLIYAAGVRRLGLPFLSEPAIGVHRIFFGNLSPDLSPEQVDARYQEKLEQVRTYLVRLNIFPEFLSFMQAFRPEDMHILTTEERNRYGLGDQDPADAEYEVGQNAGLLGISSLEYRIRERRMKEECGKDQITSENPTSAELARAVELRASVAALRRVQCELMIKYGISSQAYRNRSVQVTAKCGKYKEPYQSWRCSERFMATGIATP